MYALVITSHRSGQEPCHVRSVPAPKASLSAPAVSGHSKEHTSVNPPALFSYPALRARASKLQWLSSESWLLGIIMQWKIKGKMCTCCQENSLLFVFASFLQSFSEEPGPLLHSMPCGISLNGSLHQIACSQSQGNGKTEKGKDLLKITLRISRGKLEQEDGNFWSSDPTI